MEGTTMAELTNQQRLLQYMKLTDRMIEDASKEKLAEVLRIFALEIAQYQAKFGVLPTDEAISLLRTEHLSEAQTAWVADGLENIAATLASISDGDPENLLH
jgi:hypothetical protein